MEIASTFCSGCCIGASLTSSSLSRCFSCLHLVRSHLLEFLWSLVLSFLSALTFLFLSFLSFLIFVQLLSYLPFMLLEKCVFLFQPGSFFVFSVHFSGLAPLVKQLFSAFLVHEPRPEVRSTVRSQIPLRSEFLSGFSKKKN